MNPGDRGRKVAAVCESCGAACAALERPDGKVRPIGSPDGCCRDAELTILDDVPGSDALERR